MAATIWSRRRFSATGALAAAGAAATACSPGTPRVAPTTPQTSPARSPTTSVTPRAPRAAWRRIGARGPRARRDHTLTGTPDGRRAFLFGGRANGDPLDDLWIFDAREARWERVRAQGPSARFGHNAAVIDESLWVFGGQAVGDEFFNDLWRFRGGGWTRLDLGGERPAERYGAGAAATADRLTISHGFTFSGRFDDTWSFGPARWQRRRPGGEVPVERCLHRMAAARAGEAILLFGGQTTGRPHLGDTWVLTDRWRRVGGTAPSARKLFALAGGRTAIILFGGGSDDGLRDDTWSFDGARWERLSPQGALPSPREGVEGASLGWERMLVFGGSDGDRELDDLWELTLAG